jgi:hypothetical protein
MLREVGHQSTGQSRGRNIKFFNVEIPCCNNIPLAKTKTPYVLQRSIIRLVLVGFNVAIELQKRQCTVRSHELITDKLLYYNALYLS